MCYYDKKCGCEEKYCDGSCVNVAGFYIADSDDCCYIADDNDCYYDDGDNGCCGDDNDCCDGGCCGDGGNCCCSNQ